MLPNPTPPPYPLCVCIKTPLVFLRYKVGMTDEETALRMQLSIPDPSTAELYTRLRGLSGTFTQMKTEDLLKELPSKPLLAQYVWRFKHMDELVQDMTAHFRLVRGADELAIVLRQVWETLATDAAANFFFFCPTRFVVPLQRQKRSGDW